jgi:putative transposase
LRTPARFSPSEVPAIESLNARFRQATRRRGLPDEPAALKVFYLVIVTPQKTGPT